MSEITALDGTTLHIDDNSIVIVAGPLPDDPVNRSYITGPAPADIATNENVAALVERLHPKTPFASLTRPNNTQVWFAGSAVTLIRAPIEGETPDGETVNAVLLIGGHRQAVKESVSTARAVANGHGANV